MNTRESILDVAQDLFNERGTAEVSTNHIAAACGISPGNLYYHFRNKQEIIRALFGRMFAAWEAGYGLPEDRAPGLQDLAGLARENYALIWRHRFAYRELAALLRQDTELRERFLAQRRRGYEGFEALLQAFAAAGVLRLPPGEAQVAALREALWLVSEFWLTSLEVNGREVSQAEMERGAQVMLALLEPYLTTG